MKVEEEGDNLWTLISRVLCRVYVQKYTTNCRWKLAKGVNLDQNHKILPRATYFFHGEKNLICHGHFYSFTGKIFVYFATGSLQVSRAKFRSFLPRTLFSLSRALFRNLPRARKYATGKKKHCSFGVCSLRVVACPQRIVYTQSADFFFLSFNDKRKKYKSQVFFLFVFIWFVNDCLKKVQIRFKVSFLFNGIARLFKKVQIPFNSFSLFLIRMSD